MKRIAVINDLSSLGGCSLTAAIAVLSAMGHRVCPLPTAVLSAQTEFPVYAAQDLTALMPRYTAAWWETGERFDGVCTGYFASAAQLEAAQAFLDHFQSDGVLTLVDPVMGDDGALYPAYDLSACREMKRLAQRADVLTPNLTELCLLTDTDYAALTSHRDEPDFLERIAASAHSLANGRAVLVTGVCTGDRVHNIVLDHGAVEIVSAAYCGERFSGTGDLFAATVMGCLLNGMTPANAAAVAAAFTERAVRDTVKKPHRPLYGVNFEQHLSFLIKESSVCKPSKP